MNDESYILIKSDDAGGEDRSKFTLEKIPKKGKGKILKPVIRINWIKTNRYNIQNKTSFLTLELNKEKTEITVTLPNEKSVTYKEAEMEPQEFNPDYEWEE